MTEPGERLRLLAVPAAYFVVGLLLFTSLVVSNNIRARMAPAFSIVEYGTFAIDGVVSELPTEDVSYSGGRTYSNKAPGLLVVAVPVYAGLRWLGLPEVGAREAATWVTQAAGAVLPTAAFLFLFQILLRERYWLERRRAAVLTWTVAFGTLILPYSVVLFGHQTAGALVGIAVAWTLLDETRYGEVREWTAAGAALLLGLAVATDYLAAVPAAAWSAWFLTTRSTRWAIVGWFAAAAVAALALGGYHWACFGAPWRLPYSPDLLNPEFAPITGWHAPTPGRVLDLTVGTRRGLFFANPVWLAALPGAWMAFRRGGRSEFRVAAIAMAALLLILASWDSWHGGGAVGPRYLVSGLPLAALLLIEPVRRVPGPTTLLAVLSVIGMVLVTAASPIVPLDRLDPFFDWAIPRLVDGEAIITFLPAVGASSIRGAALFLAGAAAAALAVAMVPPRDTPLQPLRRRRVRRAATRGAIPS